MKLFFDSTDNGRWWRCRLPDKQIKWAGCGNTPIEAYEDYLETVKQLNEQEGFDYTWCKERGLLK